MPEPCRVSPFKLLFAGTQRSFFLDSACLSLIDAMISLCTTHTGIPTPVKIHTIFTRVPVAIAAPLVFFVTPDGAYMFINKGDPLPCQRCSTLVRLLSSVLIHVQQVTFSFVHRSHKKSSLKIISSWVYTYYRLRTYNFFRCCLQIDITFKITLPIDIFSICWHVRWATLHISKAKMKKIIVGWTLLV